MLLECVAAHHTNYFHPVLDAIDQDVQQAKHSSLTDDA
jgi:hypothetical protein